MSHPYSVEDGFGNGWECVQGRPEGECQMEVVRPGKVQCGLCDNPRVPCRSEKLQSIHVVDDGFGNAWQCRHSLPVGRCLMQVVRPGKCQCECDGGVPALVEALLDARSAIGHIPDGYRLLKDSTHEERSWPEDASHENGSYYCNCCVCGRQFTGHKRRVLCKVCANEAVNPHAIAATDNRAKREENNG